MRMKRNYSIDEFEEDQHERVIEEKMGKKNRNNGFVNKS